jgi:hypothetical protein
MKKQLLRFLLSAFLALSCITGYSAALLPETKATFTTSNGTPLAGGKIYTYIAGTTTPKVTYTDSTQVTANANPVILDSRGQANIWLKALEGYKVVVQNSAGVVQWTTDNIIVSGSGTAYLPNDGGTATGAYTFDTTNTNGTANQVAPIKFTHSNIYTNSPTPYLSGSVLIEATAQNNNQPILVSRKTVDSSSLGNAANLILQNLGGSTATGDSTFAVDAEFITNNPYTTIPRPEGGKFELGVLSNNNSSSKTGCGNFYIAPRRNAQHPSGANTGFDTMVNFRPWDCGGEIEHLGNLLSITPKYNNGNAKITIDNQYGNVSTELTSTNTNGSATVLLYGNTGTNTGKWRLIANGTSGRFQVRDDANGGSEALEVSSADDGLTSFYQRSDFSIGRIRLGNSSPSKLITVGTGNVWNFGGATGVQMTVESGRQVAIRDINFIGAPTTGGTALLPTTSTDEYTLINNSGVLAAYTASLPTGPMYGQRQCIAVANTITAFTLNSTDGSAVINGGLTATSLPGGNGICYIYYKLGNIWFREK